MNFYEKVLEALPEMKILSDEPMSRHTTFKIGGVADFFATPSLTELPVVLDIAKACNIPVTVDIASEFRYRNPIIDKNTLCIFISQSGETRYNCCFKTRKI